MRDARCAQAPACRCGGADHRCRAGMHGGGMPNARESDELASRLARAEVVPGREAACSAARDDPSPCSLTHGSLADRSLTHCHLTDRDPTGVRVAPFVARRAGPAPAARGAGTAVGGAMPVARLAVIFAGLAGAMFVSPAFMP